MNRKIKALLALNGVKQSEIAKQLGICRCTVSGVVNGHSNSRRIQEAIAEAVDQKYEDLWVQDRASIGTGSEH